MVRRVALEDPEHGLLREKTIMVSKFAVISGLIYTSTQ